MKEQIIKNINLATNFIKDSYKEGKITTAEYISAMQKQIELMIQLESKEG